MDFVRRANWQQNPQFLPIGTVLTWALFRDNRAVNVVTIDDGMAGL